MTIDDARAVLAAAEVVEPDPGSIPARRPFPLRALPAALRDYVSAGAHALGVAPEMIALPLLSAAAAAIGTTRALRLQAGARGWRAFAILWTLVSARSGSMKSPALEMGLEPLRVVDRALERASAKAQQTYQLELERFEAERAARGKKKKTMADDFAEAVEAAEPQRPPWRQAIVSDVTIEKLGVTIAENPRGALLARDELGAWFASHDRYQSGKSGDSAAWLELHRGGDLKVDRMGRDRVRVPMAAVSIAGGIQPEILQRVGKEHVEDGMIARFLICEPPSGPKVWREHGIAEDVQQRADRAVAALAELEHDRRMLPDGETELAPRELTLSRSAKTIWVAWYAEHAQRQARAEGPYSYALAKIEEAAARLALVYQLVEDPFAEEVHDTAMRSGVELARWFALEAERLYESWELDDVELAAEQLVAWVMRQGPRGVTAREVAQHVRRFRGSGGSGDAERALDDLAKAGRLQRLAAEPGQRGRPAVRYAAPAGVSTDIGASPAGAGVASNTVDRRRADTAASAPALSADEDAEAQLEAAYRWTPDDDTYTDTEDRADTR